MSTYDEYHRNYYLTHKQQYLENNRRLRETRRHLQRCVKCGRQDVFTLNGRSICADCVERNTAYERERRGFKPAWMRDPKPKPDVNWPRGDNGYCWQCNKRLAMEGRHLCSSCYEMKLRVWERCLKR